MALSLSRPDPGTPTSVLVIDDEDILLRLAERILSKAGFVVSTARSAEEAVQHLDGVDLVLCDDGLPGMRGSALLESVRARGTTIPFILMTGAPTVNGVVDAYEGGVTSFLLKPFRAQDLVNRVRVAMEQWRESELPSTERRLREHAARCRVHEAFDRALATLKVHFQPIASTANHTVFGYEALMRPSEPSLPHPGAVLEAGENLGRLHDVGRRVRELAASSFGKAADGTLLFVNLHAQDLEDGELFDASAPLSAFAGRVVLELTERADFQQIRDYAERLVRLRSLGYRIAVDDLGAGYAGLTSLVDLDPEIVKLDMALIRDIDRDPRKRRVVDSLVRLCRELGRGVIAEGVERPDELAVLREVGCDLVQGYLLARPGPPFPEVTW